MFRFKRRFSDPKVKNLKGRVMCNESVSLQIPDHESIVCKLRELNWLGLTVDHLEHSILELLPPDQKKNVKIHFTLPREFGQMEINSSNFSITEYEDPVDGKNRLQIAFDLEDDPSVDRIRDFIAYRNRRFSRHYSSRRSAKLLKSAGLLKWCIFFPAIIFALLYLLFQLRSSLF